jgi:hypothetical protein
MSSEFDRRLEALEAELNELKKIRAEQTQEPERFDVPMPDKVPEPMIMQEPEPAPAPVALHEPEPASVLLHEPEQVAQPSLQPTMDSVRARIINLRTASQDPQFNQYLTQLMNDMDTGRATFSQVANEVERVYQIYLERTGTPAMPQVPHPLSPPQEKKQAKRAENDTQGAEYTVGATIIGIVGSLFLLIGFITFGLNFLAGIFQGIFLYLVSAAIILGSELFVKKRLPKFSYALTGLGIAALYASTIINYLYMKIIGSLVAAIITLLIAGFSILLSRKKDSAVMRMISFIGCYLCFLIVARFQNQLEFLVAAGVLFLANIASIFFPNHKHGEITHKVHMGLNTVFIIAFAVLARQDGVMDIYIILCLILNLVLINIVCLKQEKDVLTAVLFGIETGALSIMILSVLNDLAHPYQLMSQRIYYVVLVFALIMAVCIFFYILSRDKAGKAYQYYFFIVFTVLMLVDPIGTEYIWGMLILLVAVKVFSRVKEFEAANAFVTLFAFGAGIACKDEWQTWLFFALSLLSICLIKRWRLYYQYVITAYLLIFAMVIMPHQERLALPVLALILFVLVPAFRYLVRTPQSIARDKKDGMLQMIYNLTVLGALGIISLLCVDNDYAWSVSLVTIIGAAAILIYLEPAFFMNFKKKYLLLAGYLSFMTLVIRFPNPIFASMILMLIALICVGAGFKVPDKILRICGLVLTIFVCLKMMLYDFSELESLQKTVVFMVVGAFALLISLIYIRLEKSKAAEKVSVEKMDEEVYNQFIEENPKRNAEQ